MPLFVCSLRKDFICLILILSIVPFHAILLLRCSTFHSYSLVIYPYGVIIALLILAILRRYPYFAPYPHPYLLTFSILSLAHYLHSSLALPLSLLLLFFSFFFLFPSLPPFLLIPPFTHSYLLHIPRVAHVRKSLPLESLRELAEEIGFQPEVL